MRRTELPISVMRQIVLLTTLLVLGFVGCGENGSTSTTDNGGEVAAPESGSSRSAQTTNELTELTDASDAVKPAASGFTLKPGEEAPEPLLEDWTKPAVAILLTGEQHGHLEPCGCSERQSGGLARRTDLFHQLEERGWTVTGLDLGGTLKRTRRQSEMKFDYTRNALDVMNYKGLGLGPEELKLSVLKLFEFFSRTQGDEDFDVPFISANIMFLGTRDLGTPLEYRVFEAGGIKIGVTSVIGQTFQAELFPGGAAPDPGELLIESVDDVLPGVIEKMQTELGDEKNSLMILLSNSKPEESEELAKKYPQFDIVVTAGSLEDPLGKAEYIGEAMLLKVGEKGKHSGLVGFYPDEGKLRFTTIELDRFRFGRGKEIDDLMVRYQQLLKDENLVANEPAVRHSFGEGYEFLGSEKCAECHDEEYNIWKATPHSHAYESLTLEYAQASDDPSLKDRIWLDRIHDPECINCHTTGWDPQEVIRFNSGFTGIDKTPHLIGVNCENCHGPASKHVALEEEGADDALLLAERQKMHLSTNTVEVQLCIKCHDYENSPDFEFDSYWERIKHGDGIP